MAEIVHIPDHAERILAWVPGYHRAKAGVRAFFLATADAVQELEDAIYDAYEGGLFPYARGARLDAWGDILGCPRGGLDDYWYRRLIRGKARARTCRGTVAEVVGLWAGFTDGQVELEELPPAGVQLTAWRDTYMPLEYATRAAAVMRERAPGALVLAEALTQYLGGDARITPPYGLPSGRGIPARVH